MSTILNKPAAIQIYDTREIKDSLNKNGIWSNVDFEVYKKLGNPVFSSPKDVKSATFELDQFYVSESNNYTFRSTFSIVFWAKLEPGINTPDHTDVDNVIYTRYSNGSIHTTPITSTMTNIDTSGTFTVDLTDWNIYSIQRTSDNKVIERVNAHPIDQYISSAVLDLTDNNSFIMLGNVDKKSSLGYNVTVDQIVITPNVIKYGVTKVPIKYYGKSPLVLRVY